MDITWSGIRAINGSKSNGFEELCAQLARLECPPQACFDRKGTPDAGVECYAVQNDNSEWGWQAKYFDALGDSQWAQLDKSVNTALDKHPNLVCYFVCTPLDRPDARIPGRKSAMERWSDHVDKWSIWASERGMSVKFIYWGSSELIERLSRPENVGRLRFWFDTQGFDEGWFNSRIVEALSTAGPRYTPEIHVDLPIASELEAFGRTEKFFDSVKAHARYIRKRFRGFGNFEWKEGPPSLDELTVSVSKKVKDTLCSLGDVTNQPIGPLNLHEIIEHIDGASVAISELQELLSDCERDYIVKCTEAGEKRDPYRNNPFREGLQRLWGLDSVLAEAREAITHAGGIADSALMLLNGNAGTGKTHLLCDVARLRVSTGHPTVLLMGQQFVSKEAPWAQVVRQLDLPGLSAGEVVGALEAAAQTAGRRALVLVDAINEGSGRSIWPTHLASFLTHFERSPWIGVLLSVRSSYEDLVVPTAVSARAVKVTHHGFAGHEYDASRTFCLYYGIDLPSTPLIAPEFSNPLFLKTLCRGLKEKGERVLPRGFYGITSVFDLYLSAINKNLASTLGFNPKLELVRQALEAFAGGLVDGGDRWLSLVQGEGIVNALLPGREFERSLYHGLVAEGVLLEECVWKDSTAREEVVLISYERFADHMVAKTLIENHLDPEEPEKAFLNGGALAFLWDEKEEVSPGLLEALCIQIPEKTSQELLSLAPQIIDRWGISNAFRQSLVWRNSNAFSEITREVLNGLIKNDADWNDTLEVLLTVATLSGHPLNAYYLDARLRRDSMPDRDAWWSTYLHNAWGCKGALDRLVDWAWSVPSKAALEDDVVELCATTLCWVLTSSNRYLRDRSTKALVNLLTDRLEVVERLVKRFAMVDDPYVVERIYAVAYGVALRCQDPGPVGLLAFSVYREVFVSKSPSPHILLRDYARGVVERALFLGSKIDVDVDLVRPPYNSPWPHIPTEEEIEPLLPDWTRGSHVSGELDWAYNRIGTSVMEDDFARYVIGTNSSRLSDRWLSVRIEEPVWQSIEEKIDELVSGFSEEALAAWRMFEKADKDLRGSTFKFAILFKELVGGGDESSSGLAEEVDSQDRSSDNSAEVARLKGGRETALDSLKLHLSDVHGERLNVLLAAKESEGVECPPGFDLKKIQRYILWRVFDLGWSVERFGEFDRFSIHSSGREADKAERIGKKYQWIAYHEILALISDHYQFRERYRDGGDRSYLGPWQDFYRDIDPSCVHRSLKGGTGWGAHTHSWWGGEIYDRWNEPSDPQMWCSSISDLPNVGGVLRVENPEEGSLWLNLQGYYNWKSPLTADQEQSEIERREIWYLFTGYLLRSDDVSAFMGWAENVNFWGKWMPEPPENYKMFLGEHSWSPAARYFRHPYFSDDGWTQPGADCPVKMRVATLESLNGEKGLDCSVDDGFTLRLPQEEFIEGLDIHWSGTGGDFVDKNGDLIVFDPTVHCDGPAAILFREDRLREFLKREGYAICWVVTGEKRVLGPGLSPSHIESCPLSGAFVLQDDGPNGFFDYKPE